MKKPVAILVVIVLLAGSWFFVSPLFIDRAVDEDFEFVLDSGAVDMDKIMSIPPEKRQSMMQEIMDAAAESPDNGAAEDMPPGAPVVVAQGQFADADSAHKGNGTATLYQLADGRHVIRFEDFRTTNGPALVVYLAKHPSPTSASDVTDEGFASLGKLKGNVGNQNYVVPDRVNIDEYGSVVIWCELFGVLFSPASLQSR